jgi:hypothetical protein
MSYIFEKTQILAADSGSVDAFGRWRVSSPTTLFDGRSGYGEDLQWSDQLISGTLTSSQSNPLAATIFTTTANTAGRRVRQSMQRFNYTPGKSQLILTTFLMGAGIGGNKKKVGYFDDRNGLFLQQDGSEVSFNRRSYVTGSPVDEKVVQANWNLDTFDGTGPSGVTLDLSKVQILVVDFEWLGVGRVRIGFNIDGVTYYCHQFTHANEITTVYMSTAGLPIRYEMEHSGTGELSSMHCICSTVISEGGAEQLGVPGARFSGVITGLSANTGYAMLGFRLQAAQAFGPVVKVAGIDVLGTSANDSFAWYLLRDPTVGGGGLSYSTVPDTSLEVGVGGSTKTVATFGSKIITGGLGYSQSTVMIPLDDGIGFETQADATPIPLVVVIFPYTAMSAACALRWRQYG